VPIIQNSSYSLRSRYLTIALLGHFLPCTFNYIACPENSTFLRQQSQLAKLLEVLYNEIFRNHKEHIGVRLICADVVAALLQAYEISVIRDGDQGGPLLQAKSESEIILQLQLDELVKMLGSNESTMTLDKALMQCDGRIDLGKAVLGNLMGDS